MQRGGAPVGRHAAEDRGEGPDVTALRLARLRFDIRKFLSRRDEMAAAQGLTPQHHQALLAIKGFGNGRLSVGDLAEKLLLRHHSVVGLADRLVALRLLTRAQDPADGRRVLLVLTADAERRLERLSAVSTEDLVAMKRSLDALLDELSKDMGEQPPFNQS